MGPDYIPDYYHDQGDFKVIEINSIPHIFRENGMTEKTLDFTGTIQVLMTRSIKAGLDMGIVNQIPVREGLSLTLKPNHLRNPHDLLQKAIEDNNEQRHYQLNGHNKQHLFGKGSQSMISPRKEEFYK